jgi:hypothetical protein
MNEKLKAYMVKLATNQESLDSFIADASKHMDASGLSKEDQEILISGDTGKIYFALVDETSAPQGAAANPPAAQPKQPSVLPSVVPVISATAGWGQTQQDYWSGYTYPYPPGQGSQLQASDPSCAPEAAQGAKTESLPQAHASGRSAKRKKAK